LEKDDILKLLDKVNAAVVVLAICATKVAKAHTQAKDDGQKWEDILRAEGLAPLTMVHSVGERHEGRDEPLFFDEFTNPAPGVTAPLEARDQAIPESFDESPDFRMDFGDSVRACDTRWANFLEMVTHLKAGNSRGVWAAYKVIEQVLIDEKRAIFGGDPVWDKVTKCWRKGDIVCSASDSRLSLTKGQCGALKAVAVKIAGYDCLGCKAVSDGHSDVCYSCEGLTKVRSDYKAYLVRRNEQAIKAAPLRRFTDMATLEEQGPTSMKVDCAADDYVWALVAPWVGDLGRRALTEVLNDLPETYHSMTSQGMGWKHDDRARGRAFNETNQTVRVAELTG
jgi:hypothetical protein